MKEKLIEALNSSAYKILRPLVRVMIRNGITSKVVEELVRKAFVDEAFAMSEEQNKKATVSSVSAQTGLSRKEVKRLNELDGILNSDSQEKYNRATRVLSGWVHSEDYTDADGNPASLGLDSNEPSFAGLVKQFSGDITPKAMLDMLTDAHCTKIEDDKVQLINAAYLPGEGSVEIADILGTDTHELIQTISHNMIAEDPAKRYQRKVSTSKLDQNALEAFQVLSSKHSQALLEELDDWLSNHEARQDSDSCYVSLGVYYYQSDKKGELE